MNAVTVPLPRPLPGLGFELRPPSRLKPALWLALLLEGVLIAGGIWLAEHRPATHALPAPVERVRLVQRPEPVAKPQPHIEPHPRPVPVRHRAASRPAPRIAPPPQPIALPPPAPLPPSPVAAALPPPPPPERPAPQASPGVKASYLGAVKSAIQAAVQFPDDARMLRQDGKVRVSFRLLDGIVTDVKLVTAGRMRSFNSRALSAVRDASIPAPPAALAHETFHLVLWVKFNLHRPL